MVNLQMSPITPLLSNGISGDLRPVSYQPRRIRCSVQSRELGDAVHKEGAKPQMIYLRQQSNLNQGFGLNMTVIFHQPPTLKLAKNHGLRTQTPYYPPLFGRLERRRPAESGGIGQLQSAPDTQRA